MRKLVRVRLLVEPGNPVSDDENPPPNLAIMEVEDVNLPIFVSIPKRSCKGQRSLRGFILHPPIVRLATGVLVQVAFFLLIA